MAVEILGNGAPDGTSVGKATTEKVSFHGVTPVVQATTIATMATTSTDATIVGVINRIIVALENKGILASS